MEPNETLQEWLSALLKDNEVSDIKGLTPDMITDEISNTRVSIGNEELWALGSPTPQTAALHHSNVEMLEEYISHLEKMLPVAVERMQDQSDGPARLKLKDLLTFAVLLEDVHLVHDEVDTEVSTIVELRADTLTDAGKEAWADVMNAGVTRVFHGMYGSQVELTGVQAARITEFSHMLAGYCSVEDAENWLTEEAADASQTMQ